AQLSQIIGRCSQGFSLSAIWYDVCHAAMAALVCSINSSVTKREVAALSNALFCSARRSAEKARLHIMVSLSSSVGSSGPRSSTLERTFAPRLTNSTLRTSIFLPPMVHSTALASIFYRQCSMAERHDASASVPLPLFSQPQRRLRRHPMLPCALAARHPC